MPERTSPIVVVGVVLSLLAQAALCVVGLWIVLMEQSPSDTLIVLGAWCLLATLYAAVVLIVLGRQAKHPSAGSGGPGRLQIGTAARVISIVATILPSVIGLIAAVQVLVSRDDESLAGGADIIGVWAMLVSWGLLHWGYTQIYFQRHYRALGRGAAPLFRFPETPTPRMVDFAYFSYTVGTAFATSDVTVLDTGARWLVTWHAVIAFFFNGLIIVFALSTILGR